VQLGAKHISNNTYEFTLWAPHASQVKLQLVSPKRQTIPMEQLDNGYWQKILKIPAKSQYYYLLDGKVKRADPATHFQPKGVQGPSQVINHSAYKWQDKQWQGIAVHDMIIYELHVGTFTTPGTFKSMLTRLPKLKDLGINTIEIMPVAAFPGKRNWGYDGIFPFAVQYSYGHPDDLKKVVDACHRLGMAVLLDVVYNHIGPEGNYLHEFGPYFASRYKTPWGSALNFDDTNNDSVRNFFIQNALYWFEHYHIDGLRLDAIQGIFDQSAYPFLAELSDQVKIYSQKKGRHFALLAESDLNDARVNKPVNKDGFGMDASWCDDLHHSIHALATGEKNGYYIDFGDIEMLYKALKDGYACKGQYSTFRKRHYGSSRQDLPGHNLVVCSQNHDQAGNRMQGERLASLVDPPVLRWAAALAILSPYIPLLFMGEEYGEQAPFLFFTDHADPKLNASVFRGRQQEMRDFLWKGDMLDPKAVESFTKSKLMTKGRLTCAQESLLQFYKKLIALRKQIKGGFGWQHISFEVDLFAKEKIILLRWKTPQCEHLCLFHCQQQTQTWTAKVPVGIWTQKLDSENGQSLPALLNDRAQLIVHPYQVAVYQKE
jgi:maltooligosyltrehalose trehalohydrolase